MEGPPKPVVPDMPPPPKRPSGRPKKKTVELW
jgi:hypothetical protein